MKLSEAMQIVVERLTELLENGFIDDPRTRDAVDVLDAHIASVQEGEEFDDDDDDDDDEPSGQILGRPLTADEAQGILGKLSHEDRVVILAKLREMPNK